MNTLNWLEEKKEKKKKGNLGMGLTRVLAVVLALFLCFPSPILADDLKNPVYTYGQSLTPDQKEETARLLGVEEGAEEMEVRVDELNNLLHDSYPYSMCYSSAYLQPLQDDSGIQVSIATPKNITSITPNEYANAAITAGAVDLEVTIASVVPIDGSGALAGIYKAFEQNGSKLPEENRETAQKELSVVSGISNENEDKEGYSDDSLNAAIAEMKAQIAEKKDDQDGEVKKGDVQEITNQVINNYNLNNFLTEDQKAQIDQLMEDFSKLKLTQDQKDALAKFGKKVVKEGGKLFDDVKSSWDQLAPETNQAGKNFFVKIFEAIGNFFKRIFS